MKKKKLLVESLHIEAKYKKPLPNNSVIYKYLITFFFAVDIYHSMDLLETIERKKDNLPTIKKKEKTLTK